ncbi:Aldose 1-epimerase, putative, partial [Perkinsus marinus ATCC 50983]
LESADRNGKFSAVNLNYGDELSKYVDDTFYLCCLAGRYANRIADGRMTIDGKEYQLTANNGPHCLHGGTDGFNKKIWKHTDSYRDEKSASATFTVRSEDGDQGFPGNLDVTVVFTITGNKFTMEYYATTDAPTVVNLTHHTYFNLDNDHSQTICKHELCLPNAEKFVKVENGGIPIEGPPADVKGTPFDFLTPKLIGDALSQTDEQLTAMNGLDHNYVLSGKPGELRKLGSLYCAASGRRVDISTTQPGVQAYTGNFLTKKNNAIALESQHYPNSPNRADFPSTLLRPGEKYYSKTEYVFSVVA